MTTARNVSELLDDAPSGSTPQAMLQKTIVAFIDHPFHRRTKSSAFFIKLLQDEFDVHVYYDEPDPRALMTEIADRGYDLAICWQTEHYAPYLLMRGMRVVCIPMYDGVANAPAAYWLSMRQARFLNFSERLHLRHRELGIESYYLKYFNEENKNLPQAKFENLRGFFWQRRPEEGLSYKFARNLIINVVDTLHVHNAPDTESPDDWEPDSLSTVTHFTEDAASYKEALTKANVYVCPRFTEGIGMTIVEAMARGMCIIAHDEPTANEYIVDGVNGLLVDYGKMKRIRPPIRNRTKDNFNSYVLTVEKAQRLGKKAREVYVSGLEQWASTASRIPFLIKSTPRADMASFTRDLSPLYLEACRYYSKNHRRFLFEVERLRLNGLTGEEFTGMNLLAQVRLTLFAMLRLGRIHAALDRMGRMNRMIVRSIWRATFKRLFR